MTNINRPVRSDRFVIELKSVNFWEKAAGEQRSEWDDTSVCDPYCLFMLNERFFQIKINQGSRIQQNELKRQLHNIHHILHLLNTIISWTVAGKYETKFSFVTLKSNFFMRQAILLRITSKSKEENGRRLEEVLISTFLSMTLLRSRTTTLI